jgi:hypothetical protein
MCQFRFHLSLVKIRQCIPVCSLCMACSCDPTKHNCARTWLTPGCTTSHFSAARNKGTGRSHSAGCVTTIAKQPCLRSRQFSVQFSIEQQWAHSILLFWTSAWRSLLVHYIVLCRQPTGWNSTNFSELVMMIQNFSNEHFLQLASSFSSDEKKKVCTQLEFSTKLQICIKPYKSSQTKLTKYL